MTPSSAHIYGLIAQGEHQQLDFKYEVEDARKIAKSMSAFANTDGGRLLLGVKDNGKIAGVDSEEELYVIEAAAEMYCEPRVTIDAQLHTVEGKGVLEVNIPPSTDRHAAKNEEGRLVHYIRKEDMNLQATRVHVKIWQLEREKSDRKFSYGKHEEILFDYLREHSWITFSKYCKITKQHYRKATDKMARMVIWEVLDMDFSEKGCYFGLGAHSEEILSDAMSGRTTD